MADCPECGLNLALVGRRHLCRPRAAVESVPHSPEVPVPHEAVPNVPHTSAGSDVDRVRRWRAANPERHRDYHRAYMAKRRALSTSELP